ncbi:MAG: ferredoxin reductase domain-containing protein [Planctomycetota bacterium]|jgi:sulfite reductase alpha subunit-like flavoprotein
MGSPYTSDLLYDDLFNRLQDEHKNFHYHVAISREPRPDGSRGIYVDRLIEDKIDVFGPLLQSPRALVYLCGLLGMDGGVYRTLVGNGLADAYIKLGDEIAGVEPREWTSKQIKRHIRPTARCMVECY